MKYSLEVKREGQDWLLWIKDQDFGTILEEFFFLQTQSSDFQELRIGWVRPNDV